MKACSQAGLLGSLSPLTVILLGSRLVPSTSVCHSDGLPAGLTFTVRLDQEVPMPRRFIVHTEYPANNETTTFVPVRAESAVRTGTARTERKRSSARLPRRSDRVSLGFWVGGATFGTAGCVVGYCMPHDHPVGIAASVIWWGIYIGCFGASLGALVALFIIRRTN